MDSYAENALEMAIQLRDSIDEATVTAICLGDEESDDVLRRALSFTADQAVRVWNDDWENLDGQAVGYILSKAIKSLGKVDLVLTGYQASDIEEGLVGPVLAEELEIPCLILASELIVEGYRIKATCEAENGYSVVDVPSPAVFTIVSSEKNVPRLPKVKDIRLSRSKPIKELESDNLELDSTWCQPAVTLENVYVPDRDVACEILPEQDSFELASELAEKLLEFKVL
ncbi:electron transfer flavoprotein subunit beta/FixA family protein [Cytobacillus kochii]